MKVRESSMPNEKLWETFFKPEEILKTMELNPKIINVAEFGCGYGTFTIPTSKIIKGTIYAIDIDPKMVKRVTEKAVEEKLNNIKIILRDFIHRGSGLEDQSVNYVMLFNILHAEDPEETLKESLRILKPEGKLGVIHWNYDPETPRGPPMMIRPKPEEIIKWAASLGFEFKTKHSLKPYHYGLIFLQTLKQ